LIARRLLVAGLLAILSACSGAPKPEPELQRTATIKDIMDSMVDPSAEFLFDAVATIADEHGITEKAPHTDEEWKEVRRRAVQLLEAPNLLIMKGRQVAHVDEKSENPEIELQPAQIQALIDGDRALFLDRARTLQEAGTLALKAADAKDKDALFAACERLDKACENCHLKYWYPNDQRAQEAARENR
jgi:cytochrome c556